MVSKLYDGSSWKNVNGLKLFDGSSWKNTVRGWAWDGSAWKQWYPEYPINTAAPTVSGSTTQGQTLSVTNGTWNSNSAYAPTSYNYQWRRGSSDISGATSSTYATVVADVGNAISCRVTAVNNRGTTPVISSNSISVVSALPGAPSNLSVGDVTLTPNYVSSISTSSSAATTATLTWEAPSAGNPWQTYQVTTNVGSISWNGDINNRSASITGGTSGASYQAGVTPVNNYGRWSASWTAGSGATSYDIYENGVYLGNTASTSYVYQSTFTGTRTINVRSRNAVGAESTGATASVSPFAQTNWRYVSGTFYALYPSVSNVQAQSVSSNSATISWSSTNQNSYTVTGVGTYSGGSGVNSINATGLSASTNYTATVTVTSSTGQQASSSVSFTTLAPAPTVSNVQNSTGTVPTTTRAITWSATNQASYIINFYTSGGSYVTQLTGPVSSSDRSRQVSGLTSGQSYYCTVNVYNQTNYGGQVASANSDVWTQPSAGTAPSTPTNLTNSYVSGPSWTGSWSASSGTSPITYYWTLYQSNSNGGAISATASGNTTSTSFTKSMDSAFGLWAYFTVYAQNSVGTSGTATSAWA